MLSEVPVGSGAYQGLLQGYGLGEKKMHNASSFPGTCHGFLEKGFKRVQKDSLCEMQSETFPFFVLAGKTD